MSLSSLLDGGTEKGAVGADAPAAPPVGKAARARSAFGAPAVTPKAPEVDSAEVLDAAQESAKVLADAPFQVANLATNTGHFEISPEEKKVSGRLLAAGLKTKDWLKWLLGWGALTLWLILTAYFMIRGYVKYRANRPKGRDLVNHGKEGERKDNPSKAPQPGTGNTTPLP